MSEMVSTTASMLNLDRPKPHNEEAEIAVLGAMLFSTEAVSSAMGALKLENAFYRPAHQTIFNAMVELTAGKSEVTLAFDDDLSRPVVTLGEMSVRGKDLTLGANSSAVFQQ